MTKRILPLSVLMALSITERVHARTSLCGHDPPHIGSSRYLNPHGSVPAVGGSSVGCKPTREGYVGTSLCRPAPARRAPWRHDTPRICLRQTLGPFGRLAAVSGALSGGVTFPGTPE